MSSRRFHRKSRSGCLHCKKRHIKCDEGRPICANCQRASVVCTYDQLKVPTSPAHSSSLSPGSSASTLVYEHPSTFDMLDLSLMHHYTIETSLELFAGQGSREIWQEMVPHQAQSNPLLMHGILALASMDLARTRPNERQVFATRALAHQNAGTRLFRSMLEQSRSSDSHHVLMIFSMMLAILAFAFPHACDTPPDFDGILDLFSLMRGCKTVWFLNPESLAGTPLAQWIKATFAGHPIKMKPEVDHRFQVLRARLKDPADILATDQLLEFIHKELATSSDGVSNIGRWPTMVSDAFWLRVQNHEVDSLLVLSHYSVVLGAPNFRWWTTNWDSILLRAINSALSEHDKKLIEWDYPAMMKFADSYKDN
ncbi:hypothetical protein KCU81_g1315, partial [Aureobasidium melanogenum]|uniref:Zn(2)-C6 fungal-type domain-containing protein n=1 Tax=Aureobasidium melanogenum (strain CBS 110374) TaxID=1043003 RepID=A0A074W059_AURM1